MIPSLRRTLVVLALLGTPTPPNCPCSRANSPASHIKGKVGHKIVTDGNFPVNYGDPRLILSVARNLLCNMTHRGAVGADTRDGDGAGVMTSIPHAFMKREFETDQNFKLPPPGQYAVGNIFFSLDPQVRAESQATFGNISKQLGMRILGWRQVPRDSTILGPTALSKEPLILQPIVVLVSAYGSGNSPEPTTDFDEKHFERQLYVLRKRSTHQIGLPKWFYICSLSNKNIVYKGQLAPVQVYNYFHDLNNVHYEAHFALVHSRFSTNTFPSWDRAQPLRWAAHNGNLSRGSIDLMKGEINSLRGNKNWMRAREGVMKSSLFGDDLDLLYPIVEEGGSDSAAFDNVLELLVVNGVLSLPEAVMMMVPEAWQDNPLMNPDKKAFYQWAACQMEPWDGPALFTFSDGRYCGANLDRNGLRPCRFYVTSDDMMICASEVGTIAIDPEKVIQKGRLQPGRMLLVDTVEGRIVDDRELKRTVATKQNFKEWIANQMLSLPKVKHRLRRRGETLSESLDDAKIAADPRLLAFGYTFEQINLLLAPMVSA